MGDCVVPMGMAAAPAPGAQPETAISLEDENGLTGSFAMGLQERHTQLFSDLRPPGTRTQTTQNRIDLGERHEAGLLRVGDQDHPVQPLNLIQQILNGGQQRRQRKGHAFLPRFLIIPS